MTRVTDLRTSEAEAKAKQEAADNAARKQALLKKDINETFASAQGMATLRYIMDLCGYQRPSTVADPATGEIMYNSTIYNEARRNIYLSIRKFLKRETLISVENKGLEQDEVDLLS